MLNRHGIEKPLAQKTVQFAGTDSVRGHSANHANQNDGVEVRQQFDAREDHVTELPPASVSPPQPPSFWHRAFGFCIHSDLPLSGLPPCSPSEPADVRVYLPSPEEFPLRELVYRSPYLDNAGEPILTVRRTAQPGYCFDYADGTRFYMNQDGSEVFASWPDGLTVEDTAVYLYGPILGFILRLRGMVSLHGSGIELGGRGIALVGPPGAGKSTTAAAFVQSGFRALTDDVFVLIERETGFFVQPAYPGIRLWPESVRHLWGTDDALPRLTMTWEKRYLNLEKQRFADDFRPVPIAAVYLLGSRTVSATAPCFASPPSLLDLLANTYSGYALSPAMRAHEFDVLSRFMSKVPVRKVIPHADPSLLPALCHLIEKDASELPIT